MRTLLVLLAGLSLVRPLAAQDTSANATPWQAPEIPLVPAGFQDPMHPLEESHYDVPEDCEAALQRTLDSLAFVQRGHLFRDTTSRSPWVPLPPGAVHIARQCLSHFPVADLPPFMLNRTLKIAIAANADSLVQAIVARKLAAIHGASAHTRAAVLDSVVRMLMTNIWDVGMGAKEYWTQPHVQLADAYVTQIRAFGAAELMTWIYASWSTDEVVAMEAKDVDALLAYRQQMLQQIQQVSLTSIPDEVKKKVMQWQEGVQLEIHQLQYMKTAAHADLAIVIKDRNSRLGKQAPQVTADYWFNTPILGNAPAVAASNTLSLVIVLPSNCENDAQSCNTYLGPNGGEEIRELHQKFPDLQIIVVTQTHGWFRNQDYATHPEQEAALLHHYYTDSLKLPGILGVVKTAFQKQPGLDGHVVPLPSPLFDAYQGMVWVFVDPTGMIVYLPEAVNQLAGNWEEPFLRAWFTSHDTTAGSRPSQASH